MAEKERDTLIENKNLTSKAVVVLFPDERTTGVFNPEYSSVLVENFRKTSSFLLRRYQSQGFKTFALVYGDTSRDKFSFLYPLESFDELIVWEKTFEDFGENKDKFHNLFMEAFPEFQTKLNLEHSARVAVGGYHANDCVINFANHFKAQSYSVTIDLRLTDELPFLLISHHFRTFLSSSMLNEHMTEDRRIWEAKNKAISL